MGNRALLVSNFGTSADTGDIGISPAIYLQWNGGPESVYSFLRYLAVKCRDDDREYAFARLTQVIANYFGSNLSIGVTIVPSDKKGLEKCCPGDNGIYCLNLDRFTVVERYRRGSWLDTQEMADEVDAANDHDYIKGRNPKQITMQDQLHWHCDAGFREYDDKRWEMPEDFRGTGVPTAEYPIVRKRIRKGRSLDLG